MSRFSSARGVALATLSVSVITLGLLVPSPAAATSQQVAHDVHTVHTVRTAAGGYDVYVGGAKRTTVQVSDPAYGVRAAAGPGAVALITDYDGRTGSQLTLLDVASGKTRALASGSIGSAAFASDGRLAFVEGAALFTFEPDGPVARGRVDAPAGAAELVGWTSDRAGLLVQHRRTWADAPSLSRLDLATGRLDTLMASEPAAGVVYRDFRVATVGGQQRITAIRATHVYPCAGDHSALVLADERGSVLRSAGKTADSYRSAVWSTDGRQVAYELQGCVTVEQKSRDRAAALDRLDGVNGVHVLDLATGRSHRVVRGISPSFRLAGVDAGAVRLDSARFGSRTLGTAGVDVTTADRLEAGTQASTQRKVVSSQFIHQLWDTADDFNGNSACGPTSAVMDLAGYQLGSEFRVWASSPYGHWSPYGGYISQEYTAYGTTYDAYAPDPNGNYFAGAYGWMVEYAWQGTIHIWMTDYLDRHVSYPIGRASDPTPAWIRAQIDANLMVVVSGWFAYGLYGHIGLITGYTDDGRFYVNDPYGAGTDGSYDGKNTIYTLDYMRGWDFWAA